jgi:hypothetical protein
MNKEQALTKLAALEAETKALRAIIEAPEVPVRWRPKGDEDFWAINTFGESARVCMSPTREAYGNCFQTKEQAEIASKAVSVTLKVCAAAFAVDPDAGVQILTKRHWSVTKRNLRGTGQHEWIAGQYDITSNHPCYVHTIDQAKQMADMLNAEGV